MKTKLMVVILSAIVILSLTPMPGEPADVIELKLGHLSAAGGSEDIACNRIAEVADKNSNGRIKIKIFPGAQLGNFVSQMESVRSGAQDMVWGSLAWLGNFIKDYLILQMPYGFQSQEHLDKFMDSPVGQGLKKQLMDRGWLLVRDHAAGLPKVMISKKPIFTPDDLKGIKMRIPEYPVYVKAFEALGTKPVRVTWGEAYLALVQGVSDAMECGFEFIYPSKFHEAAKFITWTYHLYDTRGAIMNPKKFNSLSKADQQIIVDACIAGEKLYNEQMQKMKVEHAEKMLKTGVAIIHVDIEPFRQKVLKIVDDLENQGTWSKGFFKKVQEIH
jgi:tripartite ATP-independent transporter DctP family solute receptor